MDTSAIARCVLTSQCFQHFILIQSILSDSMCVDGNLDDHFYYCMLLCNPYGNRVINKITASVKFSLSITWFEKNSIEMCFLKLPLKRPDLTLIRLYQDTLENVVQMYCSRKCCHTTAVFLMNGKILWELFATVSCDKTLKSLS